jgi:hypothetical protein
VIWILENLILAGISGFFGYRLFRGLSDGVGLYGDDDQAKHQVLFWIGMLTCLVCTLAGVTLLVWNW